MKPSLLLLAAHIAGCQLLLASFDEALNCADGLDNDDDGAVDCEDADCSAEPSCLAICGDGVLSSAEECDDGNPADNDGCSSSCLVERCGDGIIQPARNESCDDGNLTSGDGCSAACVDELLCGNGALDAGEECDDGNNIATDGCANCHNATKCDSTTFPFGQGFATNPNNLSCFVASNTQSSFNTARSTCQSSGGDLASIEDQAEQDIADQLTAGTEAWLGLSDSATEGSFLWVDGTPLVFTDFKPGEPNNSLADNPVDGEDCIVTKNVASEGWIDISCNFNRLFLCKFR